MKKNLLIVAILTATITLTACGTGSKNTDGDKGGKTTSISENVKREPVKVKYNYGGKDYEIEFKTPPKKAVSLSHFTTEMLLAIGVQDQIVGRGHSTNEILPEFKEAFDKIPAISKKGYPSKEILLESKPDFVTGWTNFLSEKNSGPIDFLLEQNMNPIIMKSAGGTGTLDTVYEDFEMLGKIFGAEKNAQDVINRMKQEQKTVETKVSVVKNKLKVFGYDSGENQPFAVAGGLGGNLIETAGGINIFSDIKDTPTGYKTVSWEEVAAKNPDVIVVVDYQWKDRTGYDKKVEFLKNHPILKNVTAVKNNKFVRVELADLSPGVRNTRVIKTLAKGFYDISIE